MAAQQEFGGGVSPPECFEEKIKKKLDEATERSTFWVHNCLDRSHCRGGKTVTPLSEGLASGLALR